MPPPEVRSPHPAVGDSSMVEPQGATEGIHPPQWVPQMCDGPYMTPGALPPGNDRPSTTGRSGDVHDSGGPRRGSACLGG